MPCEKMYARRESKCSCLKGFEYTQSAPSGKMIGGGGREKRRKGEERKGDERRRDKKRREGRRRDKVREEGKNRQKKAFRETVQKIKIRNDLL